MIFVTLGSQKFQFNRLLEKLDELISNNVIKDTVFAQIGASDYKPTNYSYQKFLSRDEFAKKMDEATTVITHGGTGVIISAVKKGKKVIAVPRLMKFGEHVDDHQLQLLHQFDDLHIICACYNVDELAIKYNEALKTEYKSYISNTNVIIQSIDDYIQAYMA